MAMRNSGRKGDPKALNRWFRARIMFQGATVAAIVAGSYTIEARKRAEEERLRELAQDPAMKEKLEFEARLKAAEEAYAYEQALVKAKAEEDKRSMWEKLGLGRGSHKNREAAMKAATGTTSSSPSEPAPLGTVAPTSAETVTTAAAATTSVPGGVWSWLGWGSKPEKKD